MEKDFYDNGNDTENEVFMLSVFSFPYFRPVLSPAYHRTLLTRHKKLNPPNLLGHQTQSGVTSILSSASVCKSSE